MKTDWSSDLFTAMDRVPSRVSRGECGEFEHLFSLCRQLAFRSHSVVWRLHHHFPTRRLSLCVFRGDRTLNLLKQEVGAYLRFESRELKRPSAHCHDLLPVLSARQSFVSKVLSNREAPGRKSSVLQQGCEVFTRSVSSTQVTLFFLCAQFVMDPWSRGAFSPSLWLMVNAHLEPPYGSDASAHS